MKNLTSLIKENNETKKYKYTATVVVEGNVTAMSEGDAGELADKEIDTIDNVVSYQIDNIEEVESTVQENTLGGLSDDDVAESIYKQVVDCYEREIGEVTDYYKAMINAKLRMYFDAK